MEHQWSTINNSTLPAEFYRYYSSESVGRVGGFIHGSHHVVLLTFACLLHPVPIWRGTTIGSPLPL